MKSRNILILRASLICLSIALLSGCGRYDQMSLYQPSMSDATRENFKNYREYNGYMSMELAPGIFMQLAAQGSVSRPPKLAMMIYLDRETSIRWTSDIAAISDLHGGNAHDVHIGRWGFYSYCGPMPKRICSISDIDLVDGSVEIKKYQQGIGEWERTETIHVSTDPTNRIRGARLIFDHAVFPGKEHWLQVGLPLTVNENYPDLREFMLALPPLEINGQKKNIPAIKILQQKQTIYSPLQFF